MNLYTLNTSFHLRWTIKSAFVKIDQYSPSILTLQLNFQVQYGYWLRVTARNVRKKNKVALKPISH